LFLDDGDQWEWVLLNKDAEVYVKMRSGVFQGATSPKLNNDDYLRFGIH
jgi:hypothetical protein